MNSLNLLTGLIILFLNVYNSNSLRVSSCEGLLEDFSKAASNFTSCVVQHSRPFTVCMSCYAQYIDSNNTFNILMMSVTQRGDSCGLDMKNENSVQMVINVHNFIEDSWNNNYCFDCYVKNGSMIYSESTKEFLRRVDLFNECIFDTMEKHLPFIIPDIITVNKTICSDCISSYKNMSDFYSQLDPNFNGHFCMDLSENMNFTWYLWHEDFKCPLVKPTVDICLGVSLFLTFLPMVFYLLSRICGGKVKKIFLREKRLQSEWSFASSPNTDISETT